MKVVKQHLYMRQAVFLLNVLPCLLLTLLLAACQPTPTEDVVVNKGDGVYEQKLSEAQATAAPQNGQRTEPPAATPVPCLTEPHWKGEIAFRYLTIDIDVDVEAPEAGLFPVYAVEGADFADGDARVAQVVDCLLEDVVGVRPGGNTKEEVYRLLNCMLEGTYDPETDSMIPPDEEEARWIIEEMTKEAAAAPEADSYAPTDRTRPAQIDTRWAYRLANGEEWEVWLSADSLSVTREPCGNVQPESWVATGNAVDGEPPHPLEHVELTQAEAEAIVADFLERADIGTFGISHIEKARTVRSYSGETISEGWRIKCARVCGDCRPFASRGYSEDALRFANDDDAYSPELPPENMLIYVDGGGIRAFSWSHPLRILEQVAETVELLPYEQVQERICQTIRSALAWQGDRPPGTTLSDGDVQRVVLSTCCIPQKDAPGRFYLTPAWFVLFGFDIDKPYAAMPQAIAINAVDVSRFDIEKVH